MAAMTTGLLLAAALGIPMFGGNVLQFLQGRGQLGIEKEQLTLLRAQMGERSGVGRRESERLDKLIKAAMTMRKDEQRENRLYQLLAMIQGSNVQGTALMGGALGSMARGGF